MVAYLLFVYKTIIIFKYEYFKLSKARQNQIAKSG